MPALRGVSALAPRSRRRSSVFAPVKAGVYGVNMSHLPPRPISFAPNVTPITFNESSDSSTPSTPEPTSPNSLPKLFPPSETPAPPPARKRCPPGKRRSQGYIPRPPNAFMLFRADFVRQKHVPGSIETNHGSLSKIIGNCWRSLPLDEKRVWEQKAKHEKAAHKVQYPNYRFRPIHNKNKKKNDDASALVSGSSNSAKSIAADKKDKHQSSFEEEIRCEEVTQLLLEGKKGEELAQALRAIEKRREIDFPYRRSETPSTANSGSIPFGGIMSAPQPTYPSTLFGNNAQLYLQRRPSSVPLPQHNYDWSGDYYMDPSPYPFSNEAPESNAIALPSVPFLPPPSSAGIGGLSATSDSGSMRPSFSLLSKQQRVMYGHRRSSSAGAAFGAIQRSWADVNYGGYGEMDGSFNWTSGGDMVLQRDDSALPEVDLSLFDPQFLSGSLNVHQQSINPLTAATNPIPVSVVEEEGPGVATNATATPNEPFNVSELYTGLPSQHDLGPLDTRGLGLGMMVSPVDSNGSGSANYWNPHHAPSASSSVTVASAGQYDQVYLTEQEHHAQYNSMMGSGYEDAGYDMGAYVATSYAQQNPQPYVEC